MYRKLIIELTKCTAEEAPAVEMCMRDRWHTLDGLDRAEFRREARKALAIVRKDPVFFTAAYRGGA